MPKRKIQEKPAKKKSTNAKTRAKTRAKKETSHVRGFGHSLWKGYISFGLVNIPVVLYSAEQPQEKVHFKMLDKNNLAGIRYSRINEKTGKEVPWEDIVKGYEYEDGNYAILTDEDFESVARENSKTIEIEDFINLKDLGAVYFEKPYYILPDKRGDKGYVLLRETLKKTNKIGIAKVMIRSHQYLAAIIPYGSALIVNTLRYPEELKPATKFDLPEGAPADYKISKKEFDIAEQLVETMTSKWDPKRYTNDYREDLMKVVEEKIAEGNKTTIKHVKEPHVKQTNVVDFMELLKKSVKAKQGSSRNLKDAKPRKPKSQGKQKLKTKKR